MAAVPLAAARPSTGAGFGRRLVREAELAVHADDPFFFDHPLDHVPAMLLVEGVLLLAAAEARAITQDTGGADGRGSADPASPIAGLHLEFQRFCEFGELPVARIWEVHGRPQCWDVELLQGGRKITEGAVDWRAAGRGRSAATALLDGFPRTAASPVAAELVHCSRSENVLIGGMVQLGADSYAVQLITPPPEHYLRRRHERTRPLSELMEGARQFGKLLGHQACGVQPGDQFIVRSVDIALNRPVTRAEDVVICCSGLPKARGRGAGTMTFRFVAAGTAPAGESRRGPAEVVGEARIAGHVLSPQAYQRLRRAAQAASKEGNSP
jgi:hypothetical protein